MKIDASSAAALRAVIENDLQSIDRLTASLRTLPETSAPQCSEPDAIAAGYYLHNIYNALENSFDQISRSFENHIKDLSRWHQELLHKMFLDMNPVRPAVLPAQLKPVLDELRGFRHRFRHSYDYPLDTTRIAALNRLWLKHLDAITNALRLFSDQLAQVANDSSP
jgi:small-conductance mechanosensitive channel